MKKNFYLLMLAMFFTAGSAFAQQRLSFGVSGTFLTSFITNQYPVGIWKTEMDYAFTPGIAGSVNIGFDFNSHIGLVLQGGYANLGQNFIKVINDTNYFRIVQLNYLQFPLMFKFRTGGSVARFYAAAGPQLNYMLSATQAYYRENVEINSPGLYNPENPGSSIKPGESTITNCYSAIDVMARIDLGVEISIIDNLWASAGISMGYGFLDINATDWHIKDSSGNYNPSHNTFVGFNVGINYCFQP